MPGSISPGTPKTEIEVQLQRRKSLHWLDYLILAVIAAFVLVIAYQVSYVMKYNWQWGRIPNYVLRWDEETGAWVANFLLQGVITTVRISIYASLLAVILGALLGVARCAENLAVRMLARTYLEFLRNIPPVVVVFIFYFFLSQQLITVFGIEDWARAISQRGDNAVLEFFFGDMLLFPSMVSGVIVLALFESAFVGEIVRAGIQSVGRGQREAARSIGMTWLDEMRFIVMPQAVRKVAPPLANQFISLIKDSSIVSLISVQELSYKTSELISSTHLIFEAWITTAGFYFLLCSGLSRLFSRLEGRLSR